LIKKVASAADQGVENGAFIKYGFILSRHRDDSSVNYGETPN